MCEEKPKKEYFVPAVETDEGKTAHRGDFLSFITADEQARLVFSSSSL